MGTFANVLPYANAFLMVVKEVAKAIADMFGIKLSDYNSGIASSEDAYTNLSDSVEDATGKIKELKRQTLGFDQIHNINENNDNGSGSSVSGGIDQRLLDAIEGYDNGMDKVRMKATEIRDRIMEWLGFTKEIDPLTGEVGFKYEGIDKTLSNVWKSFKNLNTQGKIFAGLGLYLLVSKLFNNTKKLTTSLGSSGLLTPVKKLLSPMKSLYNSLDDVNYANKSLTQGLSEGITNWSKSLTAVDKFKVGLTGIIGLTASMDGMYNAMKNVSNEGWNLGNSLQTVASGLGSIASGAYVGSIFGPWGAVIGGATGAIGGLISALQGYDTASEKMIDNANKDLEIAKQNLQNYYDTKKAIEDAMNNGLAQEEYRQTLLNELNGLVDANGKVKDSYEDRVNFILNELNSAYGTEYSIVDGTINDYENLNETIKEVIQTQKSQIMLDANKEIYTNAIESQKQAWVNFQTAIDEVNESNTKYNNILDKKIEMDSLAGTTAYRNYKYYSELTKETYKGAYAYNAIKRDLETYNSTLETNQQTLDNSRTLFENYTDDITFYEDLQTAVLSENVQKQNQLIEERLNKIETANGEETLSFEKQLKFYNDVANRKLKTMEENGIEITKELKEQAYAQKNILINSLVEQTKTIEEWSPKTIESWKSLANGSTEEFINAFDKIPNELKQNVINKMYENGININKELQRGLNQAYPEIKLKADTSSVESKVNKMMEKFTSTFKLFGINLDFKANGGIYSNGYWKNIPQYANGGIPSHGTLFWAGEAGAEIVAHANGRTEVLNQSQISGAIYSAMISAMSQFSGQASQIDVHVHTDEGTVVDRINQQTKQTGVCPVYIPIN